MVRIFEYNDWVAFSVLGIAALYLFMFKVLLRDISLWKFMTQPRENVVHNYFPVWGIITFGFCFLFSALFFRYIPVTPEFLSKISIENYEINKFGFMLGTLLIFFFVKNILIYLFYACTGALSRTKAYILVACRCYLAGTLLLMAACMAHFYLPINRFFALKFYLASFIVIFFLKLLLYLFSNQRIMPKPWFYKFLYICTLQIIPVLVLIKFLYL